MSRETWLGCGIAALVAAGCWLGYTDLRRRKNTSTVIALGTYSHCEYHKAAKVRPSVSGYYNGIAVGVPMFETKDDSTTTVHMLEGQTFVFRGLIDLPFPKGSAVVVSQDGWGHKVISKA